MQKFKVDHSRPLVQLNNGSVVCPKASYLDDKGRPQYHLVEADSESFALYDHRGRIVDRWPKFICLSIGQARG
jgi:hypothetical protein